MAYPRRRRIVRRRSRTNRTAHRRRSLALSVALLTLGLGLTGIGGIAWVSPRQEPVQLHRNVGVELSATPLFDPGVTVFASPTTAGLAPTPDELGCALSINGVSRPAGVPARVDEIGTRVRDGVSLLPALTLGRMDAGERLVCTGRHLDHAAVWVLPTLPSTSSAPMSVVIAGIGTLGLALLVNPRARGLTAR